MKSILEYIAIIMFSFVISTMILFITTCSYKFYKVLNKLDTTTLEKVLKEVK